MHVQELGAEVPPICPHVCEHLWSVSSILTGLLVGGGHDDHPAERLPHGGFQEFQTLAEIQSNMKLEKVTTTALTTLYPVCLQSWTLSVRCCTRRTRTLLLTGCGTNWCKGIEKCTSYGLWWVKGIKFKIYYIFIIV